MFPSGSFDYNKDVRIILYSTIPLHKYKLKTNVIPTTEISCVVKWGNYIDSFSMMRIKMENVLEKPF